MSSEGSREIEAARQRLVAAKAQASSASKMMESALSIRTSARAMLTKAQAMPTMVDSRKESTTSTPEMAKDILDSATQMADMASKNVEAAQEQLEMSKKEVEKAGAYLKDAEKRWEVIDIDDDDANVIEVDDDDTGSKAPHQSNEGRKKRKAPSAAARAVRRQQREASVPVNPSETVFVEGCGTPGANGAYKLAKNRKYGAWETPYYCKSGLWEGDPMEFALFFSCNSWYIGVGAPNCFPRKRLYRTINGVNTPILSRDWEWKSINGSVDPAPKLQFDVESIKGYCRNQGLEPFGAYSVNIIVVEGCGIPEVNGVYEKNNSQKGDDGPMFKKRGQWKGKWGDFFIQKFYNHEGTKNWYISHETHHWREEEPDLNHFYLAPISSEGNANLPQKSGWQLVENGKGQSPAPLLRW